MYIGNTPFQGLVGGGNILDASIEGVDLSTSAIAARLGYTPVDPGAAAFTATLTAKDIQQDNATYIKGKLAAGTATRLFGLNAADTVYIGSIDANHTGGTLFVKNGTTQMTLDSGSSLTVVGDIINNGGRLSLYRSAGSSYVDWSSGQSLSFRTETSAGGAGAVILATLNNNGLGIGTAGTVSAKLHIKGTEYAQIIETDSATDNDAIRLSLKAPGAQSQVELEWWNNSAKTGGGYGLIQTGKSANSPDFNFMVGNVGIGTITPIGKLDVVANNRFTVAPTYYSSFSTGLTAYTKRLYGGTVVDEFAYIGDMYYENSYTWKTPLTSYSATTYGSGTTIFYGGTGVTANTAFTPTERMRIAANGDLNVGTTVGGARLIVGTSETKGQNATPFSLTTNDASNRFELVVARSTNAYYSFQAVEQNVAYRNIVFQQDGGSVGIGQTNPQEKLDVQGNIYIHTATGNPYLKIKTDGAGNNPTIRLQADTNYWDIQSTFSNTHDDLQFLYNGTNKLAFSNNSIGGLSISNGNNQWGRLTVDTDGHQHVVRGGGLNGGDYYYRFLKLFKLKVSANTGNTTEVKGRLHLSRVNEIGVSAMIDFYATQGYSTQIRTWYKRVAGPEGAANFRFVTLVDNGNTYLCLEFISAPGWNSWQFEGAVLDWDGGRGSFAVTSLENLTVKEVGPWTTPISDPSVPLLQDTTYGPYVNGIFNYDYIPAGTNVTVASTHIFGAPQTSGNYGEAARITSNGNVLIGTTSASGSSLQIKRNSTLGSHATSGIQIDSYDTDYYTSLHIGAIDTYDIGYIQTSAKNQSWSTKSLSIQPSGGNVGIGTTSNAQNTSKLIVWGDTQLYAGTSGSSPSLVFGAETGAPKKAIFLSSFWLVIQGHNNEGIRLQTTDAVGAVTTRMTVAGNGAVTIPGSLSKGSGSFRIPHPLTAKAATHELVHSFIEGPQADLIYRGKVTLVAGQAVVNIDTAADMTSGTFEVLCREVQCFTTNETGWTAIKGKVVGNILTIEAQDPDCTDEVSWMVIGERKDQHMMDTDWTDENGKVIVEPIKPVAETQGGNA